MVIMFLRPVVKLMTLLSNVRPGGTTFQAKFIFPIRDWSSCNVAERLSLNDWISDLS